MIEKLIVTIQKRYAFSEEEAELLRSAMTETMAFKPGELIVPEGKQISYSSLLVEGFSCRSKYAADGSRQIMQFNIPGDFVDLHSYPLEVLDHSITALTDCRIVKLQHRDITQIIERHPRLARILWFATMVDASIHREWLVCLGVRAGAMRVAHLLCEMFYRLRVVGLTRSDGYHFPVTQADLAEALGFTTIHVNRLLRELRDEGLATFRAKEVEIPNLKALQERADFDPAYLYLERQHQ
jgi:CRP-like cAMP-binding protein